MKRISSTMVVVGIVVLLGGGLYALGRYATRQGYGQVDRSLNLPRVGDHWHAEYSVSICGKEQPDIPALHGDVHTHGDGRIHIHPNSPATAYGSANLGLFFRTHGGKFTKDELRYPGQDRAWKVGERCPEKESLAAFKLIVNGKERTDYDRYVPQDGDEIEIRYE